MFKDIISKILADKRISIIYLFVAISLVSGITFAADPASLAIDLNTALIALDEASYGNTTFDSSVIDFKPILDSNVETSNNNVIKIDFTVGGAKNNTADNIIYDISLVDLNIDCELLSPYIKWKLIKDGKELSNGSLDYNFDTIVNGRLVLTEIQEDLPLYNEDKIGYHNYTFYMWFSDSCQSDLKNCINNEEIVDQSSLLNRYFSGKITVGLYTSSKKAIERKPSSILDDSICINSTMLNDKMIGSYIAYTGNNGCVGDACSGQNANYVDDANMGYCASVDNKFIVNGWRIAYIDEEGFVYLISAGAPECVCTNEDGTSSNSGCNSYSTNDEHLINLNNIALKYCNVKYANGGVCDTSTTWALNEKSFRKITGISLTQMKKYVDGSANLINNGSDYWFGYNDEVHGVLHWKSSTQDIVGTNASLVAGVRPIIKLDSSIRVVSGTGSYADPYIISK